MSESIQERQGLVIEVTEGPGEEVLRLEGLEVEWEVLHRSIVRDLQSFDATRSAVDPSKQQRSQPHPVVAALPKGPGLNTDPSLVEAEQAWSRLQEARLTAADLLNRLEACVVRARERVALAWKDHAHAVCEERPDGGPSLVDMATALELKLQMYRDDFETKDSILSQLRYVPRFSGSCTSLTALLPMCRWDSDDRELTAHQVVLAYQPFVDGSLLDDLNSQLQLGGPARVASSSTGR